MNLQELVNTDLCVRLVTTLGHFLWQGALLGLGAALVALIFQKRSPNLRHNLYLAILCAMMLLPLATFLALRPQTTPAPNAEARTTPVTVKPVLAPNQAGPVESHPGAAPVVKDATPPKTPQAAAELHTAPTATSSTGAPNRVVAPFDWRAHAYLLVLAYVFGVTLLLMRLLVGVVGGGRLRQRSRPATEGALLACLARGAEALGMRVAPALAFCENVAVPTVVGVLRPMVLLPVSIASGFTPEQIEWLLLHELAHIRRWDHLINVFQRVVEAALFFHPAVWFVSNRIRLEREQCCDDVVVQMGGSAREYAGALVTAAALCAGRGAPVAGAGLAATGPSRRLRVRIERLLGGPGPALRFGRGAWVTLAALTLALATAAAVQVNTRLHPEKKPAPNNSGHARLAEVQRDLTAPVVAIPKLRATSPAPTPRVPMASARLTTPTQGPTSRTGAKRQTILPASSDPSRLLARDSGNTVTKALLPFLPPPRARTGWTEDLRELYDQLGDPDWWLRKLAVQQLSDKYGSLQGDVRKDIVAGLIAKLSDPDKRVQAAAAEALGKTEDPEAIKHIVAVLEDKGPVADAAADALTHFPADKVLPLLRLAAEDPWMRLGAVTAFAKWDQPAVMDILVGLLPDIASAYESGDASTLGFQLAKAFGKQPADRAAKRLAEAASGGDTKTKMGVAELFAPQWNINNRENTRTIDPAKVVVSLYKNPAVANLLVTLSDEPDRDTRAVAVDALGGIGDWLKTTRAAPNAAVVEGLVKRLRDKDWSVCEHAAIMLQTMGWRPTEPVDRAWFLVALGKPLDTIPFGKVAVEPLLHVFQSDQSHPFPFYTTWTNRRPDPFRRYSRLDSDTISALSEIKSPRAVPVLLDLLRKDNELSATAATALERIGGTAAADGFASMLATGSENLANYCLGRLALLKDPRAITPLLKRLHTEKSNLARQETEKLLQPYIGSKVLADTVPTSEMVKMLNDQYPEVRDFALDALKHSDDPQVAPAMIALLESDRSPDEWRKAIDYLGAKRVETAVEPLTKHLFGEMSNPKDTRYHLSANVVQALGQIGGPKAFQALIKVVSTDHWPQETMLAAVKALAATKSQDAVLPLGQLLVSSVSMGGSPDLNKATADALGALGGPDAAKALADGAQLVAKGPYRASRFEPYISALAKIAPPYSTDALVRVLKGTGMSIESSIVVAKALADLGDNRAEETLKTLTRFPETRITADAALKELREKGASTPTPKPAPASAAPSAPPAPGAAPTSAPAVGSKEWMIARVEDFFKHNFRDVTSRKTLEWGAVTKTPDGNFAIPYKYKAKIWDKNPQTFDQVFTFGPKGNFVSAREPDDTAFLKRLVEKFFNENYRDITSRGTLEWGKATKNPDGTLSIRYKFRAKIWDKDTAIGDDLFTFKPDGKFVSVKELGKPIKEQLAEQKKAAAAAAPNPAPAAKAKPAPASSATK